jgi:L-ribulose-5-phosphate 3-epimerase
VDLEGTSGTAEEEAMKKGIVIRAFSDNPGFLANVDFLASVEDYARCFDRAVAAGFEGIAPFLQQEGFFSLRTEPRILKEIALAVQNAGIAISSLEIQPLSYLLTDDDAAVRRAGRDTVRRAMEVAAEMHVGAVLVIPGYVGLPWDPSVKPVRYDYAYDRTRDGLRELVPTAEKLGVTMLVENIWNKFLLSPLEMRSLIDEIGSERVRALLDTGNVLQTGYPEQWIRILGSRIGEVHLKDYRQGVGTIEGFVALLDGDVNWGEVAAALQEIGYDGFLTAEMFPYKHHGDTIVAHTSAAMDRIMGRR